MVGRHGSDSACLCGETQVNPLNSGLFDTDSLRDSGQRGKIQ
jgi:hypothetical protein